MLNLFSTIHVMYVVVIKAQKISSEYTLSLFFSPDYFEVPNNLLRVQDNGRNSPNPRCFPVAFIEYKSDQWFTTQSNKLLSNKVCILSQKFESSMEIIEISDTS